MNPGDYGELGSMPGKEESVRGATGENEKRMKSFEEMLAPDWAEFGRSGVADGAVDDQFKREIRFLWTKGCRPIRMP